MKLPDNSIGISDINSYRECPQRFVFGMRRHVALPERLQLEAGERDEPPESTNWTNAYGSAVHDCLHLVMVGASHEEAIAEAMKRYGTYLEPGDVQMLRDDLRVFEQRRHTGVSTVASEMEARIPLFVHPTEGQIYFRFRLDLLQRLDSNPSVFLHRDYKSSKWQKSAAEVHNDPQMWAYNLGIHEYWPECKRLLQTYDQLRYGTVPTSKNDQQRRDMKQWLIDQVTVIIEDETYKPKINDFCRFCPLVVTCREPRRATEYTRGRLAVLAPLSKEGRKVKVEFSEEGFALEEIIERDLPRMIQTRKHIEHVEKLLKALIEEMPQAERERLGWDVKDKKSKAITVEGLRELHDRLGDTFYELISLPISRLEELVGKPKRGEPLPPELQIVRNWTIEAFSGTNVLPAKSGQ